MRKALLLAVLLPACVVGSDGQTPPGDDDEEPGPDPDPGSGISGNITADTTWDGVVVFSAATTIDAGVTVTVNEGATLLFGPAANLAIRGTLSVNGTQASPVNIGPDPDVAQPSNFFGGFNVSGTLTMTYGVQRGGSIVTVTGGTATITDTKMFGAQGDFLIMNGGTMNVTYSQIGADLGTPDTTHCNLHFGGTGNVITVTNSDIIGTPYGLMFYGGQLANFQNNNWDEVAETASLDWIDSQPGVMGDFSGGYFAAGVPTPKAGATFTIDNPSPTRLLNAGVGAPR